MLLWELTCTEKDWTITQRYIKLEFDKWIAWKKLTSFESCGRQGLILEARQKELTVKVVSAMVDQLLGFGPWLWKFI